MFDWLFGTSDIIIDQTERINNLRTEILVLNESLDKVIEERDNLVRKLTVTQDCFDSVMVEIRGLGRALGCEHTS